MSESQNQQNQSNDPNDPDGAGQGVNDLDLAKNPDQFFKPLEPDQDENAETQSSSPSEVKQGSFLSEFFDPTVQPPTNYDPSKHVMPPVPQADWQVEEEPAAEKKVPPKLWDQPSPTEQQQAAPAQASPTQSSSQLPAQQGQDYSFSNFQTNEQTPVSAKPQRNVPSGFFDDDRAPGTAGGAEQPKSNSTPATQYQYSGGLTAEQASFFDGAKPGGAPAQGQPAAQGPARQGPGYDAMHAAPNPGNAPAVRQTQPGFSDDPFPEDEQPVAETQPAQPGAVPNWAPKKDAPLPKTKLNLGKRRYDDDEEEDEEVVRKKGPSKKKKQKQSRFGPDRMKVIEKRNEPDDTTDGVDEMPLSQKDTISRFQKLVVTPETKGTLMYAIHQARLVFTDTKKFFKKLPHHGNNAESALMLFVYAAVGGLLAGIVSFNLLITLQFVIVNLIASYLLSIAVHRILVMMGSHESFDVTFRVIAFSSATLVIAGLKLGILGFVTYAIALFYAVRIQSTGLAVSHDVPPSKITMVVILSNLFIAMVLFCMHCI